jgi:hypothetical protein
VVGECLANVSSPGKRVGECLANVSSPGKVGQPNEKYFKSLKISKTTYYKLSKIKKMLLELYFPKIQTFKKVTAEQIWFVCSQYLLRIY